MNKNAFFNVITEFIAGMMETCPEISKELMKLDTFIDIGRNTMPKLIIHEFMEKIGPHYKQIFDQEEEYFRKNIDYENTLSTTCQEYSASDKIKNFIDNLMVFIGREWENTLSERHKLEIWGYLGSIILTGALASPPNSGYNHIIEYAAEKEKKRVTAASQRQ